MPFLSYHVSLEDGIRNAGRFLKEGGAHCVKLERAADDGSTVRGLPPISIELTEALTARGIPVMGHVGLTPQSVHAMGGYRVQGRTDEAAARLLEDTQALAKAGAFAVVLEGIPADLARQITEALPVPTIGIGAGPHCDGQVLVITDLLGLKAGKYAKFVKRYANLREDITRAVQRFATEVADGTYPDEEHSYS
jgi:3-methyl-2-oxobutanoate hydroxymethyltransferase